MRLVRVKESESQKRESESQRVRESESQRVKESKERVRERGIFMFRRWETVLIILLGFVFLPFSVSAAERLEGFVYEDGTTGGHQVDLEETGYISRIEAEGVESFVVFKIDSQTRAKDPVLKITDFSEARGKELAPGEYQLVPQLAGGVPEDEVLEPGLSGGGEAGALKAKISLEILSADEAEGEGLR